MSLDPSVALQVRRALRVLRDEPGRALAAVAAVRAAPDEATARARAFDAAMALPELAGAGELASRDEAERDDLLRVATDDAATRAWIVELVAQLLDAAVFGAFAHVLPYSFRSPALVAWARYREHLRARVQRPMWGDGTPALAQLYVPSPCAVADAKTAEVLLDPLPRLLAWITAPADPSAPAVIEVTGEAGVGKSSLLTMLAARLAADGVVHPLALRAEVLRDRDLRSGLAAGLAGFDPALMLSRPDLAARAWLLVDGLDEVSAPDDLAVRVTRDAHAAGLAGVVFATRARPAAGRRAPSRALELQPFRAPQVSAWCERWRALEGRSFEGHRFLGDGDATITPLLLFALAQVERAGYALKAPGSDRSRAAVYRDLVTWSCARRAKALGDGATATSLRGALRALAGGRADAADLEPWTRVLDDRSLIAAFPLLPDGAAASFLHRSFGEYLAAESFARRVHRMTQPVADVGDADAPGFAPDLLARWVEAAGAVELTDEALRFLAVMLPDWEGFAAGRRQRPRLRARFAAFEEALLRCFFREDLAAACLPLLLRGAGRLDDVRARALANYFALLGRDGSPRRIALPAGAEAMLPRFLGWISLGYAEVVRPVARHLSLAGRSLDADFSQLDLMGIDLRDTELDGCRFIGADLTDASLQGASMTYADLTRADLRGADLRGADLRSAVLRGALLDGADLRGAELAGVDTRGPEFAGARLRR